ncbi:MAG: tetratricopeptide repeat protein [Flavobacteriales bacterium]|nr:tetratricopeptide repeat protein [Flavobacteriales bacterium]
MNLNSKTFASVLAALMVVALTAVYWNHFDNGFHFDDSHTIQNNGFIKDIHNLPLIFQDARTTSSLPLNQAYRPMITSLNAIDFWIADSLDPTVFHWHIYLEFLLLLAILYLVFLHLFEMADGQKHYLLAILGVGFFAFHTATAETINYIIARSDGFSTLMVLVSALIYMKAKGNFKQLALIPFIIGCLAKPTTLMLAPILFMYELLLQKPSLLVKDEQAKLIPKMASALKGTFSFFVVGVAMYLFTRSMFSATWKPSDISALKYLNTQPYIFWVYIKTFFLPTGLSADTDLKLISEYFSPQVLWGLLVIAASIGLAFKFATFRKTLPIAFGILWFYVALVPSSSVIPLAEVMNHHRTFFPYIGLVMAVVWAGFLLVQKITKGKPSAMSRAIVTVLLLGLFGAHAYGTYQRNEVWDNEETLWYDVTVKSPKNGRGLMNYGLTEMQNGNTESAISYFQRTMNTSYGRHPYVYLNMGIAKNALGMRINDQKLKNEGETYLKQAVQIGPGYPDCHYYYAFWLANNGRVDEAVKHLSKALELSPAHQQAKSLLASLTTTAEDRIKNMETEAARLKTPEAYLDLSLKYYNLGQYENCIKACNEALQLKPDYAEAYNNICSAYNQLKMFNEAIEACNRSIELKPNYELAKGNLNWAKSQLAKNQ